MDILSVVVQPTWKEFLIDLVRSKQMDPWDIDLIAVSDAYLEKVRQLQAMDLRVPANVILACALLLKFKSETINLDAPNDEAGDFAEETPALIAEDIPELVYRANRPRRRKVTLAELLSAVDQVMRAGPRPVLKNQGVARELNIQLPQIDMNNLMAEVYEKAVAIKDAEGVLLFSQLMNYDAPAGSANGTSRTFDSLADSLVFHLMPVLHLVQDQKMIAWQDAEFGEIFIKIVQ